tara:strand:+ start:8395 stop:8523 length:129 start_codon:yes stop_codon:yes gene_type:complete
MLAGSVDSEEGALSRICELIFHLSGFGGIDFPSMGLGRLYLA